MKHCSREVWIDYILENLPDDRRIDCETHLYTCNLCLDVYMECLDALSDRLPRLEDEQSFGERVMVAVANAHSANKDVTVRDNRQRFDWRKTSIVHYLVASVITLIFTLSGMFHSFTAGVQDMAHKTVEERHTPYSQQLIDKTSRWLDELSSKGGFGIE